MKKPRQFTPDDLNHGEPIYFVSRSNPIPMPIENNNSNEWGYYFPNKMEAEKWARENKREMKDEELIKEYHDSIYKGSVDISKFDDEYKEMLSKTFGFSLFRLSKAMRNLYYAFKQDVFKLFGINKA